MVGRSDVAKMLESPASAEEFKKKQQMKVRTRMLVMFINHSPIATASDGGGATGQETEGV